METGIRNISSKAEYIFLILFFSYAFLHNNSFTYGHKVISYVMWMTFLLGGLLVLIRLIQYKHYYKMPGLLFLLFMLVSMGISILANFRYALKDNIVYAIYWVFFFALLYMQRSDLTLGEYKKKFRLVTLFFVAYMTVGVLASYVLMLIGYNGVFKNPETRFEYRIGFSIGRLWGIFLNPNGAAFAAATAAVLLLYFMTRAQKIAIRILCGIDVFSMLLYIALSDSRSGAICFGVMVATFAFVLLWYQNREKKWVFKGVSVLVAAALLIAGFYAPRLLKDAYNQVILLTATSEPKETGEPASELDSEFLVERGYDLNADISNRRFDIWKSAVEIYKSSPKTILVGTSFRGIVPYAKEHLPNTYIINNDHAIFQTMENEFFNVLAAQGTLGVLALAAVVIYFAVYILKRILRLQEAYRTLAAILFAVVLGLGACCMLSAVVFYHFSQSTLMFWFSLGGLIFVLQQGKEQKDDGAAH